METDLQFSMEQQPPPLINLPSLSDEDTQIMGVPPVRKRRRVILGIIVAVLLVLLLGGIVLGASRRKSNVTYQYGQVTQGNLALTVNVTGPVQSGTYNLIFSGSSGSGKITEIDVTVGQKVMKGQVLAQLDKTLLQDAVDQAQIAVNNDQAILNAAIASANSSASSSVSADQTAVSDAQLSQTQTVTQGLANVAAAQTALTNAQANLTQVMNTTTLQIQSATDTYNATCSTATPSNTQCTAAGTCGTLAPLTPTPTRVLGCIMALDIYQTTVDQANAAVAAAQRVVVADQAALAQAMALANANNITAQNNVNTAQSQLKTAQSNGGPNGTSAAEIAGDQAKLNTDLEQLVQAKHNLDNATLKAPHSGTVTLINGTVGGTPGTPSTGTTAGGTFIQIVDLSALQVQANVNEADIANLQLGETASFTVNAYGGQQFTGTVSAIASAGQTVSNVVTYPVTIDVDQSSLKGAHLLPGMTANVTINAVQHDNVLLIPVNAINFARLASSGNSASSTPQLITVSAANIALNQARQMLDDLEVSAPDLVAEGPIPAFVIEKSGQQFIAKPVVVGLTDGTLYEVLQGLSFGETFLVGTSS